MNLLRIRGSAPSALNQQCPAGGQQAQAGRRGAPPDPKGLPVLSPVPGGLFHIPAVERTQSIGKLLCIHKNASLSARYCFSFLRIRASRTEIFFSLSPTSPAMSRQLSENQ